MTRKDRRREGGNLYPAREVTTSRVSVRRREAGVKRDHALLQPGGTDRLDRRGFWAERSSASDAEGCG